MIRVLQCLLSLLSDPFRVSREVRSIDSFFCEPVLDDIFLSERFLAESAVLPVGVGNVFSSTDSPPPFRLSEEVLSIDCLFCELVLDVTFLSECFLAEDAVLSDGRVFSSIDLPPVRIETMFFSDGFSVRSSSSDPNKDFRFFF